MKNITVCGSSSMVGHMICNYFSSIYNYKVRYVEESDIFNNYSTMEDYDFLKNSNPDYIINCIRCLVEDSESNPTKAIIYNSYFPRLLEKMFQRTETQIIHLSTDCVFSGEKGNYNERAILDGHSYYAKTKGIGEIINNKDITIRTSFIGPTIDDNNEELFDWFLMQKGAITGYDNVLWTGLTTLELAKGIHNLIELGFTGLYHMVPSKILSKYNLLVLIKNIWGIENIIINKDNSKNLDRSLIDNQKLIQISNYKSMFMELYGFMKKNKDLYNKYKIL